MNPESDLAWISEILGLAPLDSPRRSFLDSNSSLDVAACPGSGKTTLVVAKLALLAKSWRPQAQGICVLSHTNVAREEIQARLGGTIVGGELLRYPHYIDTIHGFMNRFLAAPWLHSNGHMVVAIDNEIVARVRRKFLGEKNYRTLNTYLEHKGKSVDSLRLVVADFDMPLGDTFPAGAHTKMYQLATAAIKDSAKRGFFRHDEMFVFAQALLTTQPEIAAALRARFPYVLIDEMQDTTADQLALLEQVFPSTDPDICVQRVGDANQAIFEGEPSPAENAFPSANNSITLANSFRFDASIARLASGFANEAVQPAGLIGMRHRSESEGEPRHTIFLFDDDRIDRVLGSYGQRVLATFSDQTLRTSKVTAVGYVHKPSEASVDIGHSHFPKTVSHYWQSYDYTAKRRASQFTALSEYVGESRNAFHSRGSSPSAVDALATGFLKLANTMEPAEQIQLRTRPHRQIMQLLDGAEEQRRIYRDLVVRLIHAEVPIDESAWNTISPIVLGIAKAMGGRQVSTATTAFLTRSDSATSEQEAADMKDRLPRNVNRIEFEGRHVDLHVGSIHAVKGETHLSTLVVDTYLRAHYFRKLMPWLSGAKMNGDTSLNSADRARLFSAYVAMTRATHLLCLAFPVSTLGTGKKAERTEQALAEAGWMIERV